MTKLPKRKIQESLTEYAYRLFEKYSENKNIEIRKLKGQFCTPQLISKFMANLFKIRNKKVIHFLDAGAGTGVLTAAFCERLLNANTPMTLYIDAYESESALLPSLKMILELCKTELKNKGCIVDYHLFSEDFIIKNANHFKENNFSFDKDYDIYDYVILNPPYYKLNKNSSQSKEMIEVISGQPNIYTLFLALSSSMLKHDGEMVFISPRSFCSGLYYEKFRRWFLLHVQITDIHIFESRKENFDEDGVLQENIIVKVKKTTKKEKQKHVNITSSKNKNFDGIKKLDVALSDVIYHKNSFVFIRIPAKRSDVDILHKVDAWTNILQYLDMEISTGPVVPFRAKNYLSQKVAENQGLAPLIWMHNIQEMNIIYPTEKNKKPSSVCVCELIMPILLPVKNYVLVKRFSSKEQKRRLDAAVLITKQFPHRFIGIENHVNYIHKPDGELSLHEAFGIATLLNTKLIDNYFRTLNGNTQVNATDIRSLPLPAIKDIKTIGKISYELFSSGNKIDFDNIIKNVLDID